MIGVRSQGTFTFRDLKHNKRLLIIPGHGNRVCKDIKARGKIKTHSRKRK